jgi:hypothetical protein
VLAGGATSVAMFSSSGALGARLAARRCREMADLDAAAAHEGEMLRPALGAGLLDQPGHPVEPRIIDRRGRGKAERDAVEQQRHLRGQGPERAKPGAVGAEVILGDDLDDVDAVEMRENAGREPGPPAQAEAVACQLPHPPHPPSPPPDDPQLEPP